MFWNWNCQNSVVIFHNYPKNRVFLNFPLKKKRVILQDKNIFKQKIDTFSMNKWIEILIGLVLLNGAIFLWWSNFAGFGDAALSFLKGGAEWLIIMIGTVLIVLGISDLKG